MKNRAAALALALLALSVAGCSSSNPTSDFKYETNGGKVTITKYVGKESAKNVVIPAGIDVNPVVAIGETAFASRTITSVKIPDGVTTIGYAAFNWCTSLSKVTIPDSVTNIDDWAFGQCSSLGKATKERILEINPNAQF